MKLKIYYACSYNLIHKSIEIQLLEWFIFINDI